MNPLAKKHYVMGGEFGIQEVLFLSESIPFSWDLISEKVPDLPKSWYDLCKVTASERIEFIKSLWFDLLPFHPRFSNVIQQFFSKLDDIAIVIVKRQGDVFVEMVYSLADNSTFFKGSPPATFDDVRFFVSQLGLKLPQDFLSFLILHNGFGRLSDPGIMPIEEMDQARQAVRRLMMSKNDILDHGGMVVNPQSLIPFFEDFGLNSYQCFYCDWYPTSEMGNVYLSGLSYTISNIRNQNDWAEELAFTSFLDWFALFLEGMSISK